MRTIKWISVLLLISQSMWAAQNFFAKALDEREGGVKTIETKQNQSVVGALFFKTHGLLLFVSSKCPFCLKFAPVVKQYSENNQAEVLALSFDNQPLPSFPKVIPASKDWVSVAFGNEPINYPALFIINPKTRAIYPVSTGAYSSSELNEMMENMIAQIKKYEQGDVS